MHIKKSNSRTKDVSPKCQVREFDFNNQNMSLATAFLHGRYPEEGMSCNTECEQMYFVLSGKAKLSTSKGMFEIEKGDAYFFEKNEKYWLEAEDLEVVITNVPAWNPKQYKNFKK